MEDQKVIEAVKLNLEKLPAYAMKMKVSRISVASITENGNEIVVNDLNTRRHVIRGLYKPII
jgi:hypothetical protein